MKKKIFAALVAIPMLFSSLIGCSSLHVHTIDSPWESNETSHWKTCKTCHKKFEEHEHTFNDFNDKCFICDYVDPLVHINEDGEITSLTEHGKTKLTFNVPNKVGDIVVRGIGPDAFNGSKAVTVKLNKELDYYYRDSFTNSAVRLINTEEDLVKWEQPDKDGKIKKIRVFDNNVAMIDDKFYPTLAKAFDAVKDEDTTITLLRDELEIKDPIEVKHAVSLVSFYSKTNLTCNFNIDTSGILYIPDTINYQGDVKLILGTVEEIRAAGNYADKGNETQEVNTSGSLVFVNKEECPKNINVSYTNSFGSGVEGVPAHGAKQIVNDAIVALPRKHFAFGTFTFNDNFRGIRGLTKYGLTVNGLNITKVAEHIDAYIGGHAFSVAIDVVIPLIDDPVTIHMFKTKGLFFDLTIGEGIVEVLGAAFNSRADNDFSKEMLEQVAPLISHLSSLTIGPDVRKIGNYAFYGNLYLSSVGGGENLITIGEEAFKCCYGLNSVELSRAKNLFAIGAQAFKDCSSLIYLNLPAGVWRYGDEDSNLGYFPYDMTPEKIAYSISRGDAAEATWSNLGGVAALYPYSYTDSLSVDKSGLYNDVEYTDSLSEAVEECAKGGEIYISENKDDKEKVIYLDDANDNITITAAPGVKNIYVAQNKNKDDITIEANTHLVLSNVLPKGSVTLKADTTPETSATKHTAGFAIRGVNEIDLPQVNLVTNGDEPITIPDLMGNESIIRGITYEQTYGLFNFKIDGNTTRIYDTSPFGDKVQGMTVARQTKDAAKVILEDRSGPTEWKNDLIKLTISKDVEKIGDYFFAGEGDDGFNKVERLICEEGVKTIGKNAFDGCDGLISASLPNTVTTMGESAFYSCNKLDTINIPTGLTSIPEKCFSGCISLESINISDNITSIGNEAFSKCNLLRSITFSKNLESIGDKAFHACLLISRLNLPKTLTSIGSETFSGCSFLSGVYLPEGNALMSIGVKAFYNCLLLSCFDFADNVNGWSTGATPLDPEALSDEFTAATYLKTTYSESQWSRQ